MLTRTLSSLAALSLSAACSCVMGCNWVTGADSIELGSPKGSNPPPEEPTGEPSGKNAYATTYDGALALLAGTDGEVSALATHAGGASHPGTNPIDIDAEAGRAVWYQLGEIPADIAGGWVYVKPIRDTGSCSEWEPGSPHYNGDKAAVFNYFFAVDGSYLGWHGAIYQHLVAFDANASSWWTWNSATSSAPAWSDAQLSFGDATQGGLYLGDVFAGQGAAIHNGSGGELCHDHDHLHQEADGIRNPDVGAADTVSVRDDATHRLVPAVGFPVGTPPWGPPAAGGAADGPTECAEVDYFGRCEAGVLSWCEAGRLQQFDCVASGQGCGWENNAVGNNCLSSCGDLDFAGGCVGSSLRWCEGGNAHTFECSTIDKDCAWRDDQTGYDCQ